MNLIIAKYKVAPTYVSNLIPTERAVFRLGANESTPGNPADWPVGSIALYEADKLAFIWTGTGWGEVDYLVTLASLEQSEEVTNSGFQYEPI